MIRWMIGSVTVWIFVCVAGCSDYKVAPPSPAKTPQTTATAAKTTQPAGAAPSGPATSPGPSAPPSNPTGPMNPNPGAMSGPAYTPPASSTSPTPPAEPASPMPPGAGPTTTPYQPAAASPPAGQPQIRLSAGVALAQTLPDGTATGFSVDYQFVQGQPPSNSQNRYFWVIRPSKAQAVRVPVQLQIKGNLMSPFLPWRPEDGPYQSHIEDQSGRRISDIAEMHNPGL